jgi:hypothetical protein
MARIPNQIKKCFKKGMFSTSKMKRSKISDGGNPTEFAGSTEVYNKMARTPKQPIKSKKCPKKGMFSTSKMKRSKKFVWGQPDGICRFDPKP